MKMNWMKLICTCFLVACTDHSQELEDEYAYLRDGENIEKCEDDNCNLSSGSSKSSSSKKSSSDDENKSSSSINASIIESSVETFWKLLLTYVAETNVLGTWKQTGYTLVQSTPFLFDEISIYENSVLSVQGLRITNTVDLADCPAESSWRIQCYVEENGNVGCNCYIESENKVACEALTPRFKAYLFCIN